MVTKGKKTGGRQPISPAGRAVLITVRFPRELVAELKEVSEAVQRPGAEIIRDGTVKEMARLKRATEKKIDKRRDTK